MMTASSSHLILAYAAITLTYLVAFLAVLAIVAELGWGKGAFAPPPRSFLPPKFPLLVAGTTVKILANCRIVLVLNVILNYKTSLIFC